VANWSAIHTFISYRALVFSLIFVTALNLVNLKYIKINEEMVEMRFLPKFRKQKAK
jgi:hypothetical protein